jgi:hypothetical protein
MNKSEKDPVDWKQIAALRCLRVLALSEMDQWQLFLPATTCFQSRQHITPSSETKFRVKNE